MGNRRPSLLRPPCLWAGTDMPLLQLATRAASVGLTLAHRCDAENDEDNEYVRGRKVMLTEISMRWCDHPDVFI